MKLSDVVSGAGLAIYAEIALVIFLVVFLIVGIRALVSRNAEFEHASQLPFDDGTRVSDAHPSSAPRRAP